MGLGGIGRSCRLQLVGGLGSAADPRPHQPGKAGGGLSPAAGRWVSARGQYLRAAGYFLDRAVPTAYPAPGSWSGSPPPRANRHCEPMGQATREARVFDWLDRYLAA